MARKQRPPTGGGGQEIDLTPMLDVVFILLIFFIVTAQFIKEPGVAISRPDVDNKAQAKPLAILIAINANDEIYIDKKLIPMVEVGFTIKELRTDNPRGEIVVQADVNSSAETMVEVMEAINRIDGATVINISAKTNS
ncbi:MAG: biopolymer transporter ExbD [Hyphomonas sp.]|jgi:biopolymer transport protein ExbD|nr:biopolymer transporter ExbD [Hyphomonas sp.]